MNSAHFLELAEVLPEPMLLVSEDGRILAANNPFAELLNRAGEALAALSLYDLAATPSEEISRYLGACTRSRQMLPGSLALRTAEDRVIECLSEGGLVRPETQDGPATVVLRLNPKESEDGRFTPFSQKIDLLTREVAERKRAEKELRERTELLEFDASIGAALTQSNTLQTILEECAAAMVRYLDAAFARIWTLNAQEHVLELQASAGLYTHTNGAHGLIPVGKFKIGLIAAERLPHLTNSVIGDPRVSDQEWARREGMVAFAGYPLIVEDRLTGVMAMFARKPLNEATLQAMASVANGIALVIEQKRGEAMLRESEERYRIVAQTASDGILTIGEDSLIVFANKAAERIFGHRVEEMLGRELTMLMPEYMRHLHREGIKRYKATGVKHINWDGVELPGLHKNGQEIALEVSFGEFIKDGKHLFTGIVRDISERRRAEKRLIAQHAVTRVLAESDTLPEAAQRVILAICEGLGWEMGVMWEIDPKKDVLRCLESLSLTPGRYAGFEAISHQFEFASGRGLPGQIWASGRPLWVEDVVSADNFPRAPFAAEEALHAAFGFPILLGGQVLGVMEFYSHEIQQPDEDMLQMIAALGSQIGQFIERKRIEREQEESLLREQAARADAEAANRAKDQFLATISHELRTPLNAILGWSRMLRTGQLDEATLARAIETIERNAQAQAQLIEDLLDISRIISGKLRLDVRPVELTTVIEAAVDSVHLAAEAKSIRINKVLDPKAGPVSGDSGRLQQVIWNLLSNAVKFSPKGTSIQVQLLRVNSHVEIIVSDKGQGIKPDFLPYVFDRFRQADTSLVRQHGGLGLGLAIVRHLVEMHGGTVEVESEGEGKGAVFTVQLPLMPVRSVEMATASERVGTSEAGTIVFECPPQLAGLRVLVVDDERDTLDMVATVLAQCKAEVRACGSADEAMETIKDWTPDVLVSDIEMPGEDGYTFINRLRASRSGAVHRIPAVALTAHARVEDRVRALSAGFQIHVPKPVEPAELAVVIASVADRNRSNR